MTRWEEVDDGHGTRWRVDASFLASSWTCLWGAGCPGIGDEPAPELQQGCCSVGAELLDEDEARAIAALAATLDPATFQHHRAAAERGTVRSTPSGGLATTLVDGACVFLNRPGFAGGPGCALHLGAVADGESPLDWKPSVCWQLPLRVEREPDPDGGERATLRPWRRDDWGEGGTTMHWCCTEGERALVGDRPVIESLAAELDALLGPEVRVELRRRGVGIGPGLRSHDS
ncbi:MAG: hypothetical protein R2711_18915 [Acidimicrobiales bacterium]